IGRLIMLVVLLVLIAALWQAVDDIVGQLEQRDVEPWEDDYERSITYILQPGETLNFDVPNIATQLRILHTPVGVPQTDEQAELRFAARPADKLSKTYRITIRGDDKPTPENQLPLRFFDSPTGTVAGFTQLRIISFEKKRQLAEFSLTLTDSPRPLAIRVSVLEQYDDDVVSRTWQRLSEAQKQELFEDHIYPVELIPEDERRARLRHRWRPIGPSSSSTGDIDTRALFVNKNAAALSAEERVIDPLAVIGSQRWFTLDTRKYPEITAFSCEALGPTNKVGITLTRVSDAGELLSQTYLLRSARQHVTLPATPGLYQIAADQRCELTFYNQAGAEVVADYHYLRGTLLAADAPLRFALVDEAQQVQPLRLDARLVTTDDSSSAVADAPIRWAVTDATGAQLLSGTITPERGVNPYQVTVDASLTSQVHEKSSVYIVAPATAAELRVWSEASGAMSGTQTLINVYTRPADMPYRVEATEEDEPQQQLIPKWFLSRPATRAPELPPATRLISWQLPLPEPATEAVEEEHWYSLQSLEQAPYFELFLAADENAAEASTPNLLYYPITATNAAYQLATPEHDQEVRPQLIYQKGSDTPVPINIEMNGNWLRDDWLYANTGKLFLPSLKQRRYQLNITAPQPVQWFSNYQAEAGQQPYRVRSAFKLKQSLTFMVQKSADEEWLTFNYFPAIAESHQVTIIVERQQRVGVFKDYTVSKRTFPIAAPTNDPTVSLLNQDQAPVWQPIRLAFLLGQDLDSRSYRIQVTSSVPGSGFIQAGYLAEAPAYQVEIYTEDGHAPF
ncbi:hypothetical protein, partial [Pseudidiomarina sp.]|uniref:hypothetical protein n=1 Tax=Pseudidiomarina sp. TaxID=2081707 RepID=UPI00299DCA5F